MSDGTFGARHLRELLDAHGVRPRKALGQNFVIDPNTIRKMVATAGIRPDQRVLEIGPGGGSLTVALAAAARSVVAVELDRSLLPVLEETLASAGNVEVVAGDAMRLDLACFGASHLVGNLPYGIAAPLVVRALEEAPGISELTVMTQAEVGRRLAAGPGSKLYGRVSVVVGLFATAMTAMTVSRRAFFPVPRVDSVVVRIVRRPGPLEVDPGRLSAVARAAFSQRRKTLRNALADLAGSVERAEEALARAGVEPGARAEAVDRDGFIALARALTIP
ncbi:16S rRNA (adenine(1518)-N(6)/adenine(1519)-N(6))-dimethyltransferaseRsmA [soil metagenome]